MVWVEVRTRFIRGSVDWLVTRIREYFSGHRFRRQYLRQIASRHHLFNVLGLRTQGTFPLRLENVFVEPHIDLQNPQQLAVSPIRGSSGPGNRSIWDFLLKRIDAYRCLAIIGPPGAGKTTLLRNLALVFAGGTRKRPRRLIPVFLFLRDHVESIVSDTPPNLAQIATIQETDLNPPSRGSRLGPRRAGCPCWI